MNFQQIPVLTRLLVGAWFAVTGAIPAFAAFLILSNGYTFANYVLFFLLPIVLAGGCGYILGARILDPEKINTVWQAGDRGIRVTFVSYVTLGVLLAIYLAVRGASSFLTFLSNLILALPLALMVMVLKAPLLFLWIPTGIIAGILLYRNRSRIALFTFLVAIPVAICGWYARGLPNPDKLPIYPNAVNIQEEEYVVDSGTGVVRVISFETSDSPEAISGFYQKALTDAGWKQDYKNYEPYSFYSLAFGDRPARLDYSRYVVWLVVEDTGVGRIKGSLHVWHSTIWLF